jgi:hypothetical protein
MARLRLEHSEAEQGAEEQKERKKTGWKKLEKKGDKEGNSRCDTLDNKQRKKQVSVSDDPRG